MTITARHYATSQACEIEVDGAFISSIKIIEATGEDLPWIAPGLIDIQVNGFGGTDFNRPLESDQAWLQATEALYAAGCTGFLATLITNRVDNYHTLFEGLNDQLKRQTRNCLGYHLEGPWLNPDPGTKGAHQADWMQLPSLHGLHDFMAMAGPALKLITLAPEVDLESSVQVIQEGRQSGVMFFVGHSQAMGVELDHAIQAGINGWTHLGNAVPSMVAKFENVIFHTLARPEIYASLIPDGVHLPPFVFKSLAGVLGHRLLLTSDAMAAAGSSGKGTYTLGDTEVVIGEDGCARLPSSGRLAGSTLAPFQGVFYAASMAGLTFQQAWDAFSLVPATVLGLSHGLELGNHADFCLISLEDAPRLLQTYHAGEKVFDALD